MEIPVAYLQPREPESEEDVAMPDADRTHELAAGADGQPACE